MARENNLENNLVNKDERVLVADNALFDAQAVTDAVAEGISKIQNASSLEELKAIKAQYAGAESAMTKASKAIGSLPADQKKEAGKLMGKLRADFGRAFGPKEAELKEAAEQAALAAETVDMTLPVNRKPLGARHPISRVIEDIEDFFTSMGWQISAGPEVETEWFNFDALNFGPDHPARQMQDTFYVKGNQARDAAGFVGSNMVVRTQTSSDQVRALIERGVPLYIASPGRVFRTDELDATHTPVFHQIEGLAVDKHLTMANLKGVLDKLAVAMFGPEAKTRLRPSYFPFTEPSAELDLWFPDKKGGAGWLEWGGCGMVNPNVLKSAGIDPNVYTGFAFGMGIERTLLLRHDINDMHDLVEGDVRFSEQFVMGE
ncbi:Phenylalanyl-tRNA synthetase alpha chain [Bifidobacterium goeldii]|uniref:Phenylalanine--tRNA ligase alpha subunit n=1 Tax=Bifidobacterium goeldii TaxID=2306975 RepID=A0A430FKC4_9BIFI|nr:Phenylalanyl-tRNA synthetase alpha chain [Bifidobacterium goeldii]